MAQVCEEHYDCSECNRYKSEADAELVAKWEKAVSDAQAIADAAIKQRDALLTAAKDALGLLETPGDFTADEQRYVLEDLGAAIRAAEGE